MASVNEQLSEQFYKWESRGRGWQVFGEPVYPEPPFVPFHGHYLPETPAVDDGCKPTFLSSLFRKVAAAPEPPPVIPEPEEEPEPTPLVRDSLVEFQASLPAELDIGRESFDQFFRNLALCREPIAFELLGTHKRVLAQFAASAEDASPVRRQLSAHFPDVQFRQLEGALGSAWDASEGDEAFAVELGLEREFMLPLATGKIDPFVGFVGALAELQPGELGLFQVLWQPVQHSWAESIVRSVTHSDGKPFFVNSPELAGAAENKVDRPLYAAVVRIMARTASTSRLHEIARELASSLRVFANPQGNALIPLQNEDYPFEEHINDVLCRQSRRSGMILNSDELTGFVHLPASAVRSSVLLRDSGRTKAAPGIVRHPPGVIIGDNEHNGETVPVFLTADQRVRHTHIIGSNGTGKSSLLLNLIRQDIQKRDGVAVLDPHGDLIDQILGIIPAERINDVVLVDLSDEEFPIGFNILQAQTEPERRLLASDLVAVFRRLSTSWGDQMDTVLQNAILAFLKSSRGGTLADLRRFLRDPKFRSEFLLTVRDPEVLTFWQEEFSLLGGGRSIGSILARLQDFFSHEPIRNMVSQQVNNLNFEDIMDSGKIFLAKLSVGLGGEENSYLLGTLLIAKFQQLAMARQAQKIEARRDFWLYIDEFQHFISPSMEKILSGVRKYRLGFTLAHQNLHQLQADAKVASAVMTQPCTRIVLRVGDDDAKKLGDGFESFDAKSLTRLEKYHAIVRVEQNDFDFNLALRKPELPDPNRVRQHIDAIIAASRAKYATPRAVVEAALLASVRVEVKKPGTPPESGEPPMSKPPTPQKPIAPTPTAAAPYNPKEQAESGYAEIRNPPASPKIESSKSTGSEMKDASSVASVPTAAPAPVVTEIPPPLLPSASEIPKAAEAPAKSIAPETAETRDLGRGKKLHQTVQLRLQTEARKLGFLADIEGRLVKGSNEAADLLLRQGGIVIAVEIAMFDSINEDFENVQKCLEAGIPRIAVIANGRKRLDEIAEAVQGGLGSEAAAKVSYHTPDEFIAELKRLAAELKSNPLPPGESKVLGRIVRRHFPKQIDEKQKQKDEITFGLIADAIRPSQPS
jgi:hypothetical protein